MRMSCPYGPARGALRTVLVALLLAACGSPVTTPAESPQGDLSARVVVEWNQKAYDIGFAEDQFLTFKGVRAHTMMHLAQHDALNAIHRRFAPYAFFGEDRAASPVAAAAQAARDVLVAHYPNERVVSDALLTRWLAEVPDGPAKAAGIALGRDAAAAILSVREGDGWDRKGTYWFRDGVGDYRTTPDWDGFVLQPGFRFARPFALTSPAQFRPPAPPALGSPGYAKDYNEVKNAGRADSAVRTPDQTGYAVWWMEFAEGFQNRLARKVVSERDTSLWPAARLFAHLNIGLFDSYVAVWDSKYEYNHWRPFTAVREAERDGNRGTSPDPAWEPLRPTPPFPEYVSAHSAVCGSSFEILAGTFGDRVQFTMDSTTVPAEMPTRRFGGFTEAARECADSRVRLGYHFRYATARGEKLGRDVARHILAERLRPR